MNSHRDAEDGAHDPRKLIALLGTTGDELGRTQAGNNNAYCQDNGMTWIDWDKTDSDLLAFVAGLIGSKTSAARGLDQRRVPHHCQRRPCGDGDWRHIQGFRNQDGG